MCAREQEQAGRNVAADSVLSEEDFNPVTMLFPSHASHTAGRDPEKRLPLMENVSQLVNA